MSITELLTQPCILLLRDATGTITDDGEELEDVTEVDTVCELQQRGRTETGDQGELADSTWLLVLPAGTLITTGDTAVVDGSVYELVGEPWHVRDPVLGVESHVECTVRRTAGPGDAS